MGNTSGSSISKKGVCPVVSERAFGGKREVNDECDNVCNGNKGCRKDEFCN